MKKVLIIFLCMFLYSNVLAESINDIVDIKYKWYKEEITDSLYYPKKDKLSTYLEDISNIKYSDYSEWKKEYCNYSKDNYLIEEKNITTYEKIVKTKFIRLEVNRIYDCTDNKCFNKIEIYSKDQKVEYKMIESNPNIKILELSKEYDTDTIWFYIDTEVRYSIYLSQNKEINNLGDYINSRSGGEILIPNNDWILKKATYYQEQTENNISNSKFIKNIKQEKVCRVKEINTYRYKIIKNYYDNNYHSYIEGYIPDLNDYIITYKDNYLKEINNINEESDNTTSKTEYIYIETVNQEESKKEETSVNESHNFEANQKEIVYKDKYIDKTIEKIPIKIYLLIVLLIIIIMIESIKLIKKKVD